VLYASSSIVDIVSVDEKIKSTSVPFYCHAMFFFCLVCFGRN
jgi:hypothetical protein